MSRNRIFTYYCRKTSQLTGLKAKYNHYYRLILSALKGEEHDYTTINLRTAVLLLSIPMMLELALESVFAVVDIYFVNRIGVHAVSVVGLTESVITLVYSVGIGMSSAATALVARRTGEKHLDAASHAGAQAIILGMVSSFLLGIPGFFYAEEILALMGAEPEAIKQGVIYTQLLFASSVSIILLFLINGIFRGAGDASIAMKSLWLANACNIILDPLLIFGLIYLPEMGIKGAAIATVIGRTLGVLYQFYHLWRSSGILKMQWHHFKPDAAIIKSLITIASPATFQFIIASASWIFLASIVAKYGSAASAGYQTAIRLVVFFILPAWGMSNAVATLTGQNLGAGNPERAEESVSITITYNVSFMAMVTLLFLFFARPLIGFFIPPGEIAQTDFAVLSLQIICTGYIFYGVGMVITQAFNGAGDTKTPTVVYFIGFWLFQIPLAYIMHRFSGLGFTGVVIAVPVAETLMTLMIWYRFREGTWKNTKI